MSAVCNGASCWRSGLFRAVCSSACVEWMHVRLLSHVKGWAAAALTGLFSFFSMFCLTFVFFLFFPAVRPVHRRGVGVCAGVQSVPVGFFEYV